jgi:hypothetical protein
MSNICPKKPKPNRQVWEQMASTEIRDYAVRFEGIWVINGPIFDDQREKLPAGVATHAGDLWLPSVFSENLVLQRDVPAPVWGRAARGATVEATVFDGGKVLTRKTARADATTGRWRVDLHDLRVGLNRWRGRGWRGEGLG